MDGPGKDGKMMENMVEIPHLQQSWGLNRQRFAGSKQSPILTLDVRLDDVRTKPTDILE